MQLKIGGKARKSGSDRGSGQSLLFSKGGPTSVESIAFRSIYCLPTVTESVGSDHFADVHVRQSHSSRQAVASLSFSQTQMTDITGSDRLKSLEHIRSDARKKKSGKMRKW